MMVNYLFLTVLTIGLLYNAYRYHSLKRRLQKVKTGLQQMVEGNMAHRILLPGSDEVTDLAEGLNQLAEVIQLERQEQHQKRDAHQKLITNISHDLRTPLTSIAGYVDALLRGIGNNPSQYLGIINIKTQELARLIDDLFYLTRLESSDLVLECNPIDLAETLRQAVLGFTVSLEKEDLVVQITIPDKPCYCLGDSQALSRIIANLITNSLRHGTGKTAFGVVLTDERSNYTLEIWDNGRGFTHEVTRLLQRGEHFQNSGSTGLGLTIAYELAEKQGMVLDAESVPYKRTSFFLRVNKEEPSSTRM